MKEWLICNKDLFWADGGKDFTAGNLYLLSIRDRFSTLVGDRGFINQIPYEGCLNVGFLSNFTPVNFPIKIRKPDRDLHNYLRK